MAFVGIPPKYVKEVCKLLGGEACCAYLVRTPVGFACAKDDIAIELIIRGRLKNGTMGAKGENCPGWNVMVSKKGISVHS